MIGGERLVIENLVRVLLDDVGYGEDRVVTRSGRQIVENFEYRIRSVLKKATEWRVLIVRVLVFWCFRSGWRIWTRGCPA